MKTSSPVIVPGMASNAGHSVRFRFSQNRLGCANPGEREQEQTNQRRHRSFRLPRMRGSHGQSSFVVALRTNTAVISTRKTGGTGAILGYPAHKLEHAAPSS